MHFDERLRKCGFWHFVGKYGLRKVFENEVVSGLHCICLFDLDLCCLSPLLKCAKVVFGTMLCAYDCYVNDISFGRICCVELFVWIIYSMDLLWFDMICDLPPCESSELDSEREVSEDEEAAPEGQQQQAVQVADTTMDEPLGLGYRAARCHALELTELRSLEQERERAIVTFGAIWRPVLPLEAWTEQTNAQRSVMWQARYKDHRRGVVEDSRLYEID
ncbi:hypothetical protein Tco_0768736 [Tanacetum coccineum]